MISSNAHNLRKNAKVFAGFTGSSVLGTITQVLRGKLTALWLGTAGVGVLNQLTSFASVAQVLASFGINVGIVRSVARAINENDADAISAQISSAGILVTATSVVTTGVVALNSRILSDWLFADDGRHASLVALIGLSIPLLTAANLYKSMLSGARAARRLINSQIASDTLSVVTFIALIYPLGLTGAILAYVATQFLLLGFRARAAFFELGWQGVLPRVGYMRWSAVRENFAYGISGLVTAGTAVAALLLVSRHIIATMGEAENGVFTTAAKVGTLFLSGVYAAASNYTLPSLIAASDRTAANIVLSETTKLYLFTLPPVMAGLMAFGEPLIQVLFAHAFAFAGVLLVPMLTADFLRVLTETIGLTLVANRKLTIVTGSYLFYAAALVGFVYSNILGAGLLAIGTAFVIAQSLHLALIAFFAWSSLGVVFSRSTIVLGLYTLAYVGLTAATCLQFASTLLQLGIVLVLSTIWTAANLLDSDFRHLISVASRRLHVSRRAIMTIGRS